MKNLLENSNFFYSHNVVYSIRKLYPHLSILMTSYLYSAGLEEPKIGRHARCRVNPIPNKHLFLFVHSTNLLKTLREKEKLLVTSNFSLSHSVFCPFGDLSAAIFIKFKVVVCELFRFGTGQCRLMIKLNRT